LAQVLGKEEWQIVRGPPGAMKAHAAICPMPPTAHCAMPQPMSDLEG
jgi:hypothetical protein